LDAEAAHLHLRIRTPQELQYSVAAPARQVPAAVHPAPRRAERVRNKPFRRQPRSPHIATRQPRTRDVKLPTNPGRNRLQTSVQNINSRVPDRTTDRSGGLMQILVLHRVRGDLNGRLRWPVKVDQRHLPGRDHIACNAGSERLTTREDASETAPQVRFADRKHRGEQGGNELRDRNALLLDVAAELARVVNEMR